MHDERARERSERHAEHEDPLADAEDAAAHSVWDVPLDEREEPDVKDRIANPEHGEHHDRDSGVWYQPDHGDGQSPEHEAQQHRAREPASAGKRSPGNRAR